VIIVHIRDTPAVEDTAAPALDRLVGTEDTTDALPPVNIDDAAEAHEDIIEVPAVEVLRGIVDVVLPQVVADVEEDLHLPLFLRRIEIVEQFL
jgi:hypothetical protein